jgi:hypothetical protein
MLHALLSNCVYKRGTLYPAYNKLFDLLAKGPEGIIGWETRRPTQAFCNPRRRNQLHRKLFLLLPLAVSSPFRIFRFFADFIPFLQAMCHTDLPHERSHFPLKHSTCKLLVSTNAGETESVHRHADFQV